MNINKFLLSKLILSSLLLISCSNNKIDQISSEIQTLNSKIHQIDNEVNAIRSDIQNVKDDSARANQRLDNQVTKYRK